MTDHEITRAELKAGHATELVRKIRLTYNTIRDLEDGALFQIVPKCRPLHQLTTFDIPDDCIEALRPIIVEHLRRHQAALEVQLKETL